MYSNSCLGFGSIISLYIFCSSEDTTIELAPYLVVRALPITMIKKPIIIMYIVPFGLEYVSIFI